MKRLKDLSKEELKNLYENNEEFRDLCINEAYNNSMSAQAQEGELLGVSVFDFHDHYNSFYLRTPEIYGAKTPESVAGKLDADYMTPENAKLYKKLCDLDKKYSNFDYEQLQTKKAEQIYDKMTEICDELADGLTDQLRAYEDVSEEQVLEDLSLYCEEGYGYMSEWKTDGKKVYQEITKVYQ